MVWLCRESYVMVNQSISHKGVRLKGFIAHPEPARNAPEEARNSEESREMF
jgi:hypothetical protein